MNTGPADAASSTERSMDTPEIHPVHAETHASARHWTDYVMSGAALLVSAISLWVAVHHGRTMERLVQANSFPNVQVDWSIRDGSTPGSITFAVSVANTGVGPARLETLELWADGKPIGNFGELIAEIKSRAALDRLQAKVAGQSVIGTLLGAGRDLDFASVEMTSDKPIATAILDLMSGLAHRVCYCSVFDECFVADTRERRTRPARVEACAAPATPYDDALDALLKDRLKLGAPAGARDADAGGGTH